MPESNSKSDKRSLKGRAKDIMSRELVVGREDITLEEAIKILVNNRITGFPIVDGNNKMLGVLSELDVIVAVKQAEAEGRVDLSIPVSFSTTVQSIDEDTSFKRILETFLEKKVRRLPVVNEQGQLTGIVTRRDVMKALFYMSKQK